VPKTTGTFWVFPEGQTRAFRATFTSIGDAERTSGVCPLFDPATAKYATSDMVTNLVARSAATGQSITIRGDEASATRILSQTHDWKTFLSLQDACSHAHLGKTMPTAEVIIARFAERIGELEGLAA